MKTYHYLFALLFLGACDLLDSDPDDRGSVSLEDLLGNNSGTGQAGADGSWVIGLFEDEGFDLTQNYTGVTLTFADSGVLEATWHEGTVPGRWRIERESGSEELEFLFPENTALGELGDDWRIVRQTVDMIALEEREDGYVNRLTLVRSGQDLPLSSPYQGARELADQLYQELETSEFTISRITSDTRDRSSLFQGSVLVFLPLGRLELQTSVSNKLVGNWQVGFNDQDVRLKLDLQDDGLGDLLDEDWMVRAVSADVIQLKEKRMSLADDLELQKK